MFFIFFKMVQEPEKKIYFHGMSYNLFFFFKNYLHGVANI